MSDETDVRQLAEEHVDCGWFPLSSLSFAGSG